MFTCCTLISRFKKQKQKKTKKNSDIRALKSSNVKLTSATAELISSNANLLEKVHNLEASKNDIPSTLQSVSLGFRLDAAIRSILSSRQHSRKIHALNRRLVLRSQ
jgi:predicted RNase H-like nuclease (RuvC/YqgF family)